MIRALGIFSGGLDSLLAVETLRRQGVEVAGVVFVTPFFGAETARQGARLLDMPLWERDISQVHWQMLQAPHYGYGKHFNPCIDCHALMFAQAGLLLEEQGYHLLFSGEVLGQRPKSQNHQALQSVANHSGYGERILRPLSARLLPETQMEQAGWVDRSRLLDLQGRSRRPQEALARQWGLSSYPAASGGCLLTEKDFSRRLQDLLYYEPDAAVTAAEYLKYGRIFRLSCRAKLTLGRHQQDNEALKACLQPGDTLVRVLGCPGPLGVVSGQPQEEDVRLAGAITAAYGKGRQWDQVEVLLSCNGSSRKETLAPLTLEQARAYLV